MEISAATTSTTRLNFNQPETKSVDYNPPPSNEGITPSRKAIIAEVQTDNTRGRNLDIFA